MATELSMLPTQILAPFKGVKKVTIEEYFTSGHRTCQGCESALVMKLMAKAAGPRTIILGSTGSVGTSALDVAAQVRLRGPRLRTFIRCQYF